MISDARILGAKILVVDDEVANVLLLKKMMSISGYNNVESTTDSREATKLYTDFEPDVVLLDLKMPHFDGFEIIEQFKNLSSDPFLPVLVLTAERDKQSRHQALEQGARDYLEKPLDRVELLKRMRNIIEMRMLYGDLRAQNDVLEERVQQRTKELQETRPEIVRRLAHAAEWRDDTTGDHITRMSLYCSLLGAAVGMSLEHSEMLLHASPLHDVGKIAISDEILLKPGRLDHAEWQTMKRHATIGGELLGTQDSDLLNMARSIALTHHEKWDGSGYPEGLQGDAIPIEGRVASLCDVFDALTSERPYKKAWTVEEAMDEITKSKGTHFDPDLVEAYESILPDVVQIKEQFSEWSS